LDWFLLADIQAVLDGTIAILMVAVGLGFVIFVHELGHFVVAKLCGVKCEKFYLGFDIGGLKLAKFTWGETEYGIGILPLGGYVKMLGQEDNPARMREEIERAKTQAEAEEAGAAQSPAEEAGAQRAEAARPAPSAADPRDRPLPDEQRAEPSAPADAPAAPAAINSSLYDPRSYLSQSVPKRMAIISAGVIMNLVFAFVMAAIAFGMGVRQIAGGVGGVLPGETAWQVGMRVGDDIVSVDGERIKKFRDLREAISLGDNGTEGRRVTVRRPGREKLLTFTVTPDESGLIPMIGILSPRTNTLAPEPVPVLPGSAAAKAEPELKAGDMIVEIAGQPTTTYAEVEAQLALNYDKPLEIVVERLVEDDGGEAGESQAGVERIGASVPTQPMRRLGLVMEMGEITAVQDGSPAAAAGFKRGDVIRQVDFDPPGGPDEVGNPQSPGDPMTLPQRLRARAGKPVRIFVEREGREGLFPIDVTLRVADWYEEPMADGNPISAPVLGVVYVVLNRVHAPIEGSPAAEAGMAAGDEVVRVRVIPPPEVPGEKPPFKQREAKVKFDPKNRNWPSFLFGLQKTLPGTTVEIAWKDRDGKEQSETIEPYAAADWLNPDRGFVFKPRYFTEQADSVVHAVVLGWQETVRSTFLVYRFIQKLGTQDVSPRALGGPVSIFIVAKSEAEQGASRLLIFLTLLSANLAVINFLPIPLLDGGHMVLLAYEGVRGKPPDERVQVVLTYIGLAFILTLMIWVLGLDFGWIPRQ